MYRVSLFIATLWLVCGGGGGVPGAVAQSSGPADNVIDVVSGVVNLTTSLVPVVGVRGCDGGDPGTLLALYIPQCVVAPCGLNHSKHYQILVDFLLSQAATEITIEFYYVDESPSEIAKQTYTGTFNKGVRYSKTLVGSSLITLDTENPTLDAPILVRSGERAEACGLVKIDPL